MELRNDSIGFLLADVSRLMRQAFQTRMQGSSLTQAQARALFYVSRHEGVRQVDLAELLEIQPITLARLIDHLQSEGLVERRPDPADRRAYQVYLTGKAKPHLNTIDQVAREIRTEILDGLDQQQVDTLLIALRSMRDKLSSR
jgi:DNA-binding MarR family transcriptional regulator